MKVERMQVKCPVDGVVQTGGDTTAGEMADPARARTGRMVVVKNDPLWVEMHPSADRALKLHAGAGAAGAVRGGARQRGRGGVAGRPG